ncbi:MAG: hypothetical protein ACXVYV_06135 [Gaiellales bacterium]
MRRLAILTLAAGVVGAILGAGALGLRLLDRAGPSAGGTSAQVSTAAALPRMVVAFRSMPAPSRPGAALHVMLAAPQAAVAPQTGIVLSDEACTPDAAGVSHCLNRIRLADGTVITVVHPHRMAEVPCLAPGERVRVAMA